MSESSDNYVEPITNFIKTQFRVPSSDPNFTMDCHLFDEGYVDSIGVVELIAFIESTFDINIPEESMFGEDFTTINGISRIVEACTRERASTIVHQTNSHGV